MDTYTSIYIYVYTYIMYILPHIRIIFKKEASSHVTSIGSSMGAYLDAARTAPVKRFFDCLLLRSLSKKPSTCVRRDQRS